MSTSWATIGNDGTQYAAAERADGHMHISMTARAGYVFSNAEQVDFGLTVAGARSLAAVLTSWANSKDPSPSDVVRFKQLLDELNDLAVAIAAKGEK